MKTDFRQFVVWLASTTSFRVSKNWGPAVDPNVLWGYTCSPTAKAMNAAYPEIVKFYVECQVQVGFPSLDVISRGRKRLLTEDRMCPFG
jgi:hypothetical protein